MLGGVHFTIQFHDAPRDLGEQGTEEGATEKAGMGRFAKRARVQEGQSLIWMCEIVMLGSSQGGEGQSKGDKSWGYKHGRELGCRDSLENSRKTITGCGR
jgi:hypothetical protein